MMTRLPIPFPPPPAGTLLRLPARLLPGKLHARGLALILNRLLATPLADNEVDFLDGRILQIEVLDLGLDYRLTLHQGRLQAAEFSRIPDVRFAGRAREFLLLACNQEDPDTLFFQRRLQLEGDTELGLEIKNLLYALDDQLLPRPIHRFLLKIAPLLG